MDFSMQWKIIAYHAAKYAGEVITKVYEEYKPSWDVARAQKRLLKMSAMELRALGTRTEEQVVHEDGIVTDCTYRICLNGYSYHVYLGPGVRIITGGIWPRLK